MANRTVSVNLVANIGQYVSGMNAAAGATTRLGSSVTDSTKKAQSGFDLAGKGALVMGAAVVGGLAMAVSKSMEFEKAMSAAAAGTQAAGAALGDLRAAAMKAGADTQYSATEAAQAITEMGKAGVSTADILDGGLNGALSLAAAGQLDVAKAAEIASVAMTQFKLAGDELPHVADLLAAGAGKAMGSVEDLGMALNQAGLVASSTGLSIEETTGTLAAFASAGLIGSDAGTSLKTMLQRLQAPSEEAAGVMADLGVNMYDATGHFVGMAKLAGQLRTGMADLTPATRDAAMATIFGSDAVRAANVLYAQGAAGIADWTKKVDDQGYAAEQAAKLNDNLAGDLEKLGGAFDTLLINLGEGAQGPLRDLVQGFTGILDVASGVIDFWESLPGPVQATVAGFGAIALLNGPLAGLFTMLQVKAVLGANAFLGAALSAEKLGTGIAKLITAGVPLALLAVSFKAVSDVLDFMEPRGRAAAESIEEIRDTIDASDGSEAKLVAIADGMRELRDKAAEAQEVVSAFEDQNWFNEVIWKNPFGSEAEDASKARAALERYREEIERLEGANRRTDESTTFLADKFKLTGAEVTALADKYGVDLTGSLSESRRLFENFYTAEYGTTPTDAANATGEAMMSAKARTEEAQEAQEAWLESLQQIGAGFAEPLSIYKGLLDEKMEKERESAEKTAASTESSKDSWKDYVGEVAVSLDEYAAQLEEQIAAQENWRANLVTVTQRGGLEVGQILAGMGAEGAQITADMATATDAEFTRMADAMIADARLGGSGATAELDNAMKVMAIVGAQGAAATASGIAKQLGLGVDEVAKIAGQYGVTLATGINPVITALGRSPVTIAKTNAKNEFAEGGYTGPGGKYQPAGIVHAGEYVLTKEQTDRLGIDQIEAFANRGYANGGFVTAADVPKPRSTAPYRPPISTAGDATMQKGYDEVVAWMEANAVPPAGASGPVGSGAMSGSWTSIFNFVKARIPEARANSTYRPGDPGYHGRNKAVDFGFGSGPGGAGSAGLASINRLLHDSVGGSLAELIYDGIGDDRPDLKNGRPLTYSAGTRAEHRNHVHAAVYHQGTDYVPQTGWAYLERGEAVIPASANPRSREFSGGGGGFGGSVNVAAPAVKIYIDGQEFRGIARVEAAGVVASDAANRGRNARSS